jgi:TonB-linked SusC/RagA family outer membrane protein
MKIRLRILLITTMLTGSMVTLQAQQNGNGRIAGNVRDTANKPIAHASVEVLNQKTNFKKEQYADESGFFAFENVPAGDGYKIIVGAIGYLKDTLSGYKVAANGNISVSVTLKNEDKSLSEVVVIGYGTVKKRDVTGSISTVKSDKIAEFPVSDPVQLLQGRVAGLVVQTQSWQPGGNMQIRVRGNRSITANNSPLYVVDGIPIEDAINQLTPNDIESMEILKDASATAIYGNRGANGVIIITTKKGFKGKTVVEYNSFIGPQKNRKMPELMDAASFVEYSREAQRNSLGGQYDAKPNRELDFKNEQLVATPYMRANMERAWESGEYDASKLISTDWIGYGLREGLLQDHQISVRGGNEPTQFLISGDYFYNKGVVRDQDFKRYSIRLNARQAITDNIRVGTETVFSRSTQNAGWSVFDGYGLKSFNPLASPYEEDGTTLALFPTNNTRTPNPLTNFDHSKRVRNVDRFLGNYYLEVSFLNNFKLRSNLGLDYRLFQSLNFDASNTANAGGEAPSSASNSTSKMFSYILENVLNYNKTFGGDHNIFFTAVQSIQSEQNESAGISVKDLPYDQQLYYNVGSALTINGVSSNLSKWNLASFMGRLNYSFRGKYLATVSTRYDGSSRLAVGKKWVAFPSVALAWRIKEENFLIDSRVIDDLKLRVGWGRTGNSGITPYTTWGKLTTVRYVFGGSSTLGFSPTEMINPNLTWETTGQYNAGIDFSLFRGRVSGSIEGYLQNTHDLLLNRQLPIVSGFSYILSNVGKTRNKGLELTVRTVNVQKKNFEWSTDWIFAANKEEIVELYNGKVDDIGAQWFIGKPVNVYYDLGNNGIWQNTAEDLAEMAKYNANGSTFKPGDIRPLDKNGDYKIDANDRYIIGQLAPKWTASWAHNFRYKNFDANIFLVGMFGQTVNHDLDMRFDGRYNQPAFDYWTPTHASKLYPRPLLGTASVNYLSTLNYYSGSYVRVQNITVGYTVPKPSSNLFNKFRVYASIQNPFLITNFPGTDPEGAAGFDNPSVTSFLLGLNIAF